MKKYLLATICAMTLAMSSNIYAADEHDNTMPPPPSAEQMMKHRRGDLQKELADKLNLSEEQRAAAKKIHEDGRTKMKPLMEEARALHEKMDKLRKENMAEFENILTSEQKDKMEQLKQEFRKKMQSRKPHHRPHFNQPKPEVND